MNLYSIIKSDKENNSFASFIVLLFYRLSHYLYVGKHKFMLHVVLFVQKLFFCILNTNAQISYEATIGYNIRLPHKAMGCVISSYAILHNNITIYHQVTLGINESLPEERRIIEINDNCYLSTGCKIISCKLAEGCKIAPNAVVYKDVPPNSLVYTVNEVRLLKNSSNTCNQL